MKECRSFQLNFCLLPGGTVHHYLKLSLVFLFFKEFATGTSDLSEHSTTNSSLWNTPSTPPATKHTLLSPTPWGDQREESGGGGVERGGGSLRQKHTEWGSGGLVLGWRLSPKKPHKPPACIQPLIKGCWESTPALTSRSWPLDPCTPPFLLFPSFSCIISY